MDTSLIVKATLRMSRNLRGIPFPSRLNEIQKAQLTDELSETICRAMDFSVLSLNQLSQAQLYSLAEQQIIESEHAKSPHGKAVLFDKNHQIFININCDNHLELIYFDRLGQLKEAYEALHEIDIMLERLFPYAFDDEFGFLSSSLSSIGTGLEASICLHLPAIKENRGILRTGDYLSQLGLTLRGCYGAGNDALGAFYQLTNRLTLGISEETALDNLVSFARQLAHQERLAEEHLKGSEYAISCMRRAVSELLTSPGLTFDEAITIVSDLFLCSSLGMCSVHSTLKLCDLLDQIQPATLLNANLQCMSTQELDIRRAELLRSTLTLNH